MKELLNIKVDELLISEFSNLTVALRQMDKVDRKLLIVVDSKNKYKSILSVGDIQRHLIEYQDFGASVSSILRPIVRVANTTQSLEEIKKDMLKFRTEFMPVVDNEKLIGVYFWEDIFGDSQRKKEVSLNIPVVIMAGGRGTRLKPLTNIIPKPLIPISEKTIIEEIMDKFVQVGCHDYYLSVNYKVETIKHYFAALNNNNYNIEYFQEDKPLGTAGSMYLLKGKINSSFFVSNCDILIDQDIEEIYKYHKENNNLITIVSALKHYKIPYGTIKTGKYGVLTEMSEKPELTFQINTGVYLLEPQVLDLIPDNKFYHITQLIEDVRLGEGEVGVFPISEGAWQDIGDWDEYLKYIKK
jgi:dTDP-glucose pyrophosphorylase